MAYYHQKTYICVLLWLYNQYTDVDNIMCGLKTSTRWHMPDRGLPVLYSTVYVCEMAEHCEYNVLVQWCRLVADISPHTWSNMLSFTVSVDIIFMFLVIAAPTLEGKSSDDQ